LEKLSNGLLELAQYQINQNKVCFDKFSLKEVIDETAIKLMPMAEKKHIKIKQNSKVVWIKADRDKIAQIISILLDNAIKYSPDSSSIWLEVSEENKNVLIIIKDQGIGIKASDLPYIYNRFYRVDQSRSKEKHPGYGLGLAIAKQIVDFHKGSINVESSPNKGTIFIVKIPVS
jgi:signal transduction histidine kinase